MRESSAGKKRVIYFEAKKTLFLILQVQAFDHRNCGK